MYFLGGRTEGPGVLVFPQTDKSPRICGHLDHYLYTFESL